MKKTIQILIIAIGILLFTPLKIHSQISNSSEIGNKSLTIPQALKSETEFNNSNHSSLLVFTQFNKKVNGYINIISDNIGLIVSIKVPDIIRKDILIDHYANAVPCPHCLPYHENKDCVIECLLDIIFN